MNWNLGFSAQYYAHIVDPATWRDLDRLEITGGNVNRTVDALRASASLDCVNYQQGRESWVRIYLDAKQNDSAVHVPLFTGIATSPGDDIDGTYITNSVDCYSVLKPTEDILLERGWYAQAGADGGALLASLLSATPAPVTVAENAPTLKEAIIAEDGESHLTMIDKVLAAIDWRIRIAGDGTLTVGPKTTDPVAEYDPLENDAIEPQITVSHDWFECPNVFRAVSGDTVGIARDDSQTSPLSTVNRGREIWREETSCELNAGETIAEYATRRLGELQRYATTAKYTRRYNPDIMPGDIVELNYPAQGLSGLYHVTGQSIELTHGAPTSEDVSNE